MKLNEFIELLAETKDRYKWTYNGELRCTNRKGACHCPITAVAAYKTHKKFESPFDYDIAASKIGIDENLMDRIVSAADGCDGLKYKRLRNRMLRALGIQVKRR